MHNVLRAVAALAPGKRVMVLTAAGAHELPLKPPPAKVEPPHPLELVSKQLLERDAEARSTITAVAARADETLNSVKAAVADVAAGQAQVAQCVEQLAATLELPTEPIYDDSGKLIGAQRVKKLGAKNAR